MRYKNVRVKNHRMRTRKGLVRRKSHIRKIPKKWKGIKNELFIHGDFDKDRVPNIDDVSPFDSTRSVMVEPSVSMSKEFKKVDKHRKSYNKLVDHVQKKTGAQLVRVKGTFSTLGKLRRRHLHKVEDMGGVMVVVDKEKHVHKKANQVRKKFVVKSEDNYYKKSKAGYYARHLTVLHKGKPIEVQIKTKRQKVIQDRMHKLYKEGKTHTREYKKLKQKAREVRRLES